MKRSVIEFLRSVIEKAAQSLDDATALAAVLLYPEWAAGQFYTEGCKIRRSGKLWRCRQTHASLEGWEPENAASLWEQINETHAGTLADPIPYEGNMALDAGMYYVQDGVVYLCIRDTGIPVFQTLDALNELYVEAV